MTTLSNSDVFLVGSVPVASDTSEEVLRLCANAVGDRVFALPDGEVGDRRMWIGGLGKTTFSRHPDLQPAPDVAGPFGAYRLKPSVKTLSLINYLPYADAALSSYEHFRKLRAGGTIPADVRFQVSLPTPHAAIGGYFGDIKREWPMLMRAYEQAIVADIGRMLEGIPAEDLVIQWDYCTEICDIVGTDSGQASLDGLWPWNPKGSAEEKFAQHTAASYVAPLTEPIPPQVLCGYHICLGTWPQVPFASARDLSFVVRVANALVKNTPRRVDFLHLPVVPTAGREFFAPLTKLDIGAARVFLGLEAKDGPDALRRRAQAAREFLPSFGVSHYCGYGRDSVHEMPTLLGDLRSGADHLKTTTKRYSMTLKVEQDTQPNAPETQTRNWSCYTTTPARTLEIFEQARAQCPVAHSREHNGFYMLLNYDDVKFAMGDPKTFSSEPQVLRPMLPRKPIPALEMDAPRHAAWRAIFNGAITAKTPKAMESFVRADIERHIDDFIERGSCDLIHEIAEPVPAETICRLVGIDEELVPKVRETALAMFAAQGNPEEFGRRQAAFAAVTVSEVHKRRANPRDDYLTQLASVEIEGRRLDDNDYVVLLAAFLGAGHHSTTSAMASLVYEVFSRPEVRDTLKGDAAKISVAIDEALRLRPPFFGFYRRATRATQVSGIEIPAGADVYMGWAAANRDPTVFESPTEYRLNRRQIRNFTFGFGAHTCPGAPLAKMELRVLLEELLRRLPDLRVAIDEPVYNFGGGDYVCIDTLPVTFTPGTRL